VTTGNKKPPIFPQVLINPVMVPAYSCPTSMQMAQQELSVRSPKNEAMEIVRTHARGLSMKETKSMQTAIKKNPADPMYRRFLTLPVRLTT
jgi:hypothetical protein